MGEYQDARMTGRQEMGRWDGGGIARWEVGRWQEMEDGRTDERIARCENGRVTVDGKAT